MMRRQNASIHTLRHSLIKKMTYTIEESDLERQHVLAEMLNPFTANALKKISLSTDATILDIGCGLGDTTRLLHQHFPNATIVGLDANAALIAEAVNTTKTLSAQLGFVTGDAQRLPFSDNHFDFVFTRALLHHLHNPSLTLTEMKRVCKVGGIVMAQEPDLNSLVSYPERWAYARYRELALALFADGYIGRKLIHYFTKLDLKDIQHIAQTALGDQRSVIKKFYRMTAVALGNIAKEKKLITAQEQSVLVDELLEAENDSEVVVLIPPNISVWGTKQSSKVL